MLSPMLDHHLSRLPVEARVLTSQRPCCPACLLSDVIQLPIEECLEPDRCERNSSRAMSHATAPRLCANCTDRDLGVAHYWCRSCHDGFRLPLAGEPERLPDKGRVMPATASYADRIAELTERVLDGKATCHPAEARQSAVAVHFQTALAEVVREQARHRHRIRLLQLRAARKAQRQGGAP